MFVGSLFSPWAVVIGLPIAATMVIAWFWPTTPRKEGKAPQEGPDVAAGEVMA
jgi:hypothetical protein